MKEIESYAALLASMPVYEGKLPDSAIRGIQTNVRLNPDYVSPDLVAPEHSEPSSMLLLRAPGAMGKSEAAREAAARLNSPYVNLAEMRVGSGTLTGELTKALGATFTDYVAALKEGRASLVLDSTDEAQLAAGAENYYAFLGDVAWLLLEATASNQVLLLGRRDATDSTFVLLHDLGYSAPVYELAPLNEKQASSLIDLVLDKKHQEGRPYVIHRQHSEPFARLRSALFMDIAGALNPAVAGTYEWGDVDYFLGYPPVLLAISERLAVENPSQELAEFEKASSRQRGMLRGALLREIVETILDRESSKVRGTLCTALAIRPDAEEARHLYGRDEQVARLLVHTGALDQAPPLPAVLDASDHAKYEELVAPFLQDHPFIHNGKYANAVFSDYVLAWAVSSPLSTMFGSSRRQFLSSLPLVGPFFSSFAHALTASDPGSPGRLAEDLVATAIRSNSIGSNSPLAFYVEQGGEARLGLLDQSQKAYSGALNFEIQDPVGVVEFVSPINNLTCVVETGVIIRGTDGRVEFGPHAAIVAADIEIVGRSFVFMGAANSDDSWSLISGDTMSHESDLKVSSYPEGAKLGISWTDPWFQWKPFEMDMSSEQGLPRGVAPQVYLFLRRLLTSFGSSVTSEPGVSADKVDRVLIGANPVFRATIGALEELGVVHRQEMVFRLNLATLGSFGVSYASLRGDDPSKLLRELFKAVVETSSFKELKI